MQISSSPDTWLLVAPNKALHALEVLIETHRARRPVKIINPERDWTSVLGDVEGVLLVGDRRRTPRTALPGPFVLAEDGRRVPVGWLPFTGSGELRCFSAAAAEVQSRSEGSGPIALLGQWDDHVTRTVTRALRILKGGGDTPPVPVFWWTADRIIRRDLLTALRLGLGLALYSGHGRPYGWSGYHGLHSRHLLYAKGLPTGAILSLTCHTANRHRVALSFAEMIPLAGIAAAAFGAVRSTRTLDNWWWGISICEALSGHPRCTIGELVLRACPPRQEQWECYRIIGDPLAPLIGASSATEDCANVWAPAPDDSPIPPGYLENLVSIS